MQVASYRELDSLEPTIRDTRRKLFDDIISLCPQKI